MYESYIASIYHISHKKKNSQSMMAIAVWLIPLYQNDVERTLQHCKKESRTKVTDITSYDIIKHNRV